MINSSLLQYLNFYFADGPSGMINYAPVELVPHFLEEFGVDVKNENDLYLFKYNMISAYFQKSITHECRGIILRYNKQWEVVARPFNKFFNSHEGYCPLFNPDTFTANLDQLKLISKEDGTCIQAWYDKALQKWRISTLGTITTQTYSGYSSELFEDLFIKTLGKFPLNVMYTNYTYLFELCTKNNQIVSQYSTDRVYILAIRNTDTGEYQSETFINSFIFNNPEFISKPKHQIVKDLNVHNLKDLCYWVEQDSGKENTEVKYPEGYVVYLNGEPIAKIKNSLYLSAHDVCGGNIAHAKNSIIDATFLGHLDDVYDMLTPELKEFADSLKLKVNNIILEVNETIKTLKTTKFENQKEYALYVQKNVTNTTFRGFFFQNKDAILNGDNSSELLTKWITENYKKFEKTWKDQNE